MRRLVGIFLCLILVFGMAGCAQATAEAVTTEQVGTTEQAISEVTEEITAADSHVLVSYFSRTGNYRCNIEKMMDTIFRS